MKTIKINKSLNKFNQEDGFTLLELLAAIAISAIILTAIYSLFTFAFNGFNTANDLVMKQQDLLLVKNYFDVELKHAEDLEILSSVPGSLDASLNYIYLDNDSIRIVNDSGSRQIARDSVETLNFEIKSNNNSDSFYNYSLEYTINDKHQSTMILSNLKEYTAGQNNSVIAYRKP